MKTKRGTHCSHPKKSKHCRRLRHEVPRVSRRAFRGTATHAIARPLMPRSRSTRPRSKTRGRSLSRPKSPFRFVAARKSSSSIAQDDRRETSADVHGDTTTAPEGVRRSGGIAEIAALCRSAARLLRTVALGGAAYGLALLGALLTATEGDNV